VSRYHARITCEDGAYYVTDLDSANGTYLGSTRLAPHNPTYWRPDQPLRVGEVIINLQQVSRPAAVIESAETMLGHFADETPMKQAGLKPAQHKTWPMWLAALAAALCALAAAGTGAYYWLAG
jgi:predicted component of type VI protein secretion system